MKKVEVVEVADMVSARDRRVEKQSQLISEYNKPLVSLTMNIAGPIKRYPLVDAAFKKACDIIGEALDGKILNSYIIHEKTGDEALFVVDMDAEKIKEKMCRIEEMSPIGRLYDIDVIGTDNAKLSRNAIRKCLICNNDVFVCSRSRAHSVEEINKKTNEIIIDAIAFDIGYSAFRALNAEVNVTPKPGLVDKNNTGSHNDMNISTFFISANALFPYFTEFAKIGLQKGNDISIEFLKDKGIEAEKAMFTVTKGVNTHKGLIFSLGIICAATGACVREGENIQSMFEKCKIIAEGKSKKDFDSLNEKTCLSNGEKIYVECGIKGVRGEAMNGFPNAKMANERYNHYFDMGFNHNECSCLTLIDIMQSLDDTNVINRGGVQALEYVKGVASELKKLDEKTRLSKLEMVDSDFIKKNISPGGAADVLATCFMMELIKPLFET